MGSCARPCKLKYDVKRRWQMLPSSTHALMIQRFFNYIENGSNYVICRNRLICNNLAIILGKITMARDDVYYNYNYLIVATIHDSSNHGQKVTNFVKTCPILINEISLKY